MTLGVWPCARYRGWLFRIVRDLHTLEPAHPAPLPRRAAASQGVRRAALEGPVDRALPAALQGRDARRRRSGGLLCPGVARPVCHRAWRGGGGEPVGVALSLIHIS